MYPIYNGISLVVGFPMQGYMEEIAHRDIPQDLRSKDTIIFGNIRQIYEFHRE